MHHANLLVGSVSWALAQIPPLEKEIGPDVRIFDYDRLQITHVRTIISETNLKPVTRSHRTFIIICSSILVEAQNALLKLFEEPNSQTLFYIVLPRVDILLPTLKSRLYMLGSEELSSSGSAAVFDEFKKESHASRLVIITKRLADEDTPWSTSLFEGYSLWVQKSRNERLLREALVIDSFRHLSGSSKKMLLEHIALLF